MINLTKNILITVAISKEVAISVSDKQSVEEAAYDSITGIEDDWEIENIIITEI